MSLTLAALIAAFTSYVAAEAGEENLAAPSTPAEEVLAELEFTDTTVADAVKLLARTASLNLLFDPRLMEEKGASGQPSRLTRTLTVRYEKLTARQALSRLLQTQNLVVRWSPKTQVGRITTSAAAAEHDKFARVWEEPLPNTAASTNLLAELPVEETPFLEAVGSLIRETGMNIMLDPVVAGRLPGPGGQTRSFPAVEFRLVNLTGLQALAALLENHGLTLAWSSVSSVARVTTQDQRLWELEHPLRNLPPLPTPPGAMTAQALVFIDDTPLADAVLSFCRPLGLNVFFAPDLLPAEGNAGTAVTTQTPVEGKFRNLTTLQAVAALLENYGLALVWNTETTVARILTRESYWSEISKGGAPAAGPPKSIGRAERAQQIALHGVSLDAAIIALAQLAGLHAELAPELTSTPLGAKSPAIGEAEVWADWENLTSVQALTALLESYGLAADWDANNKTVLVRPRR